MRSTFAAALATLGIVAAFAEAAVITVPAALTSTEGSGNYVISNLAGLTFQQVVSASQLTTGGLEPGSQITGLRFRANGPETTTTALSLTTLNISVGKSNFAPGSLTSSVAGNQGADTVLARSGSITFAANSFPVSGSPNLFGAVIPFTTPYTYTGGPLLLTINQSASNRVFRIDAAGTGSALAGTDFQSRQGGFNSTTVSTINGTPSTAFYIATQYEFTPPAPIPEPASLSLLACAGMLSLRRRSVIAN